MTNPPTPPTADDPHFWPGWLDVAFVLCAPGAVEADRCTPASGLAGMHLDLARERHLTPALPTLFPSVDRLDYRIVGAHASPPSGARGGDAIGTAYAAIGRPDNVARVRDELAGCRLVVLCGEKTKSLAKRLSVLSGFPVVLAGHPGMKDLNKRWTGADRRAADPLWDTRASGHHTAVRIALWAREVEDQVLALLAAGALRP